MGVGMSVRVRVKVDGCGEGSGEGVGAGEKEDRTPSEAHLHTIKEEVQVSPPLLLPLDRLVSPHSRLLLLRCSGGDCHLRSPSLNHRAPNELQALLRLCPPQETIN